MLAKESDPYITLCMRECLHKYQWNKKKSSRCSLIHLLLPVHSETEICDQNNFSPKETKQKSPKQPSKWSKNAVAFVCGRWNLNLVSRCSSRGLRDWKLTNHKTINQRSVANKPSNWQQDLAGLLYCCVEGLQTLGVIILWPWKKTLPDIPMYWLQSSHY